ncbi:MAG: hypothetical protein ACI8ZB_005520 [Desulforhopalus sp.]|jgi:hypothetical protein
MYVCNVNKLNLLCFQHKIYDLGKGYYDVLEEDSFCRDLQQYLNRLLGLGHKAIIANILEKIGTCVVEHKKNSLRVKALGVVTEFTKLLRGQRDKDYFQIVATIISGWIGGEQEYHKIYDQIFVQIGSVIKKMLSLQLWREAEPLVTVSYDVNCSSVSADIEFKKKVSKLHSEIADQEAIQSLMHCFLESKEPSRKVTGGLLKALAPHSSEAMITSLFKCSKKETRLALLEMIPEESEGVLPVLIGKLKDRQPWYVVRNSMILLGTLRDSDLYSFARPFLCHPDSRVQSEVLHCTVALGGKDVSARLVTAFQTINDDVKEQLIDLLVLLDGPNIETLFLEILEQRTNLPCMIRERLATKICSSDHIRASRRSLTVLRDIVQESNDISLGFDSALDAARKLLSKFEDADNQP